MPVENQEIYVIILTGAVLALLLVGFIVTILFLYQRKQHRQEQELTRLKDQYDRELLQSQLEIQEATLKGIAQELHDNIGQVLSVIKLSLSVLPLEKQHGAFESVENCRRMLNQVILDLSGLTKSMHTDRIAQIGLGEAIGFELEALRKTGLLQIDFSIIGQEYSLDDQKSIFLFRMFQEMINNILKHSKAKHANIVINYSSEDKFVLKVSDDGIGFSPDKKRTQVSSSSGIGLKSMLNRARLINATISIDSEEGKGSAITVELPVEPELLN